MNLERARQLYEEAKKQGFTADDIPMLMAITELLFRCVEKKEPDNGTSSTALAS